MSESMLSMYAVNIPTNVRVSTVQLREGGVGRCTRRHEAGCDSTDGETARTADEVGDRSVISTNI